MKKTIYWFVLTLAVGLGGCSTSPIEKLDDLSDRLVKSVSFGKSEQAADNPVAETPKAGKPVAETPTGAKPVAAAPVAGKPMTLKSSGCEPKGKGTGFIRVDYLQGDVNAVYVEGLSKAYMIGLGQFVSEKVPLGEYRIKGSGQQKGAQEVSVCVERQDDIRVVLFTAINSGSGQFATATTAVNLTTGYGMLKVVSTQADATFEITSPTVKDFKICFSAQSVSCNVPESAMSPVHLKAPSEYRLPVGQYSVVHHKIAYAVTIEPDQTTVVELKE